MNLNLFFTNFTFFLLSLTSLFSLQVSSLSYLAMMTEGEKREVKLTLINESDSIEKVSLHLSDYGCNSEGNHFYEQPGTFPRSNAAWIQLQQNQLTLLPKQQVDLFYTIQAPSFLAAGSYWSVLLIEPLTPLKTIGESQEGYNFFVKVRFAHHIIMTVGQSMPLIKILKHEIQDIEDKKYLAITVINKGPLFIQPKATLKLYNGAGILIKTVEGSTERLYPENSQRYLLDISSIPQGLYKAFLLLDNGDQHLFGDHLAIEI